VKVVVHVHPQVDDHHVQQMMMLLHMDCGRSKLSLLEADLILLRNLDFEDMYATTVVQKVVFHHKLQTYFVCLVLSLKKLNSLFPPYLMWRWSVEVMRSLSWWRDIC